MEIDFDAPKQQPKHLPKRHRTTTGRLVTLAAVAALTVGGAAACASTTASAKPSSTSAGANTTPSSSGSPSIQPGGPIIRVPSPSATGSPSGASGGSATATPTPGGQAVKGTGYSSDGDELTVYFYAGICDKYGLRADQSTPGEVLVSVVVTQPEKSGTACPMLVRQQQLSTDLGAPLDGRRVVDSGTGQNLPQLDAPTGTKYYSPGPTKIGG
ncbi:hypothetical protein [Streptacidiphilus sp. P02-A3a]|uniref:hypothetical protein n=1 Tax=Streptacidiphilus sp. P02-A3a TaxID=2704468 RepID=UPI0015FC42D3|nr:hypothetical protein [Streptacidiphilus sp. P02-A3a]QMU68497.1 hypothetical protein GXP74_09905 [Streptacidiphilus sp. P02-A3a]